jgi:uncharacterized protein YxjI
MQYPLTMTFKIVAVAPQITVTDATGKSILYVKQKVLKLKEKVEVFSDDSKSQKLAEISADKVIDWSANYTFTTVDGTPFGSVKRSGTKSLWKAHYDIKKNGETLFEMREGNPWTKFFDSLFTSIPILGMFSGYVFHPTYEIKNTQGELCYLVTKKPAFWEGVFEIEEPINTPDDIIVLLSILMMTLLERQRG